VKRAARVSETPNPNTGRDLRRIHGIITRGIDVSIEKGSSFARDGYTDSETREGYANYVQALVSVLHGHHLAEDELIFPYMRDRLPDVPYDSLEADHREMRLILDAASTAIEAHPSDAQERDSLDDLVRALTDMRRLWHPHIQTEESHFTEDKLDRLMDASEHIELGRESAQHAQAHSGPDFLVVPFLLYNLSPEERAVMAQSMPPVVTQELVPIAWKDKWASMKPFLLD
jgi:hemerythrin-like domain-containing protein